MIQIINAPISVTLHYDHKRHQANPVELIWEGRTYAILKVGYHHTYRQGRTLMHVYSVATATMFFRLVCDTETFMWRVEQIADAETN